MKQALIPFLPIFWARNPVIDYTASQISLSAILPAVGETRVVYFEPFNLPPENQSVDLLWLPPISELNGWDTQPSELLSSQIVSGVLRKVQAGAGQSGGNALINQLIANADAFEFEIKSVESLVAACLARRNLPADWDFPTFGQEVEGKFVSVNLWQDVHWCGLAEIDGIQYLCATGQENYLELLLMKEHGNMIVLMHGYFTTFSSELLIGAKTLSVEETRLMESIIHRAVVIQDSFDAYLV